MKSALRKLLMTPILGCILATVAAQASGAADDGSGATLVGRAVLPAQTFADGPRSGTRLGPNAVNGVQPPFPGQPVQGFSAMVAVGDGTYWAMPDNGYGAIENSADFEIGVYRIRPNFRYAWTGSQGGHNDVTVGDHIVLHDPDRKIPFAIVNDFTTERALTGADFDIESLRIGNDGSFYFGDEFGPFLLHTDAAGRVLDPPVPLPGVSSPQNPFTEEGSAVRVMNAVAAHARAHGATKAPVFSPYNVMLDDGSAQSVTGDRETVPAGSGLARASSEVFNVKSLQDAGYPVVTWTVNDQQRMAELLKLGVNGIISDRPDLLYRAVSDFDQNGDGKAGDLLLADGRIDPTKFDAQGHRGGRNLRPENTLPAFEVALDNLMTTIETDTGLTKDHVSIIKHDPAIDPQKCRRSDGKPFTTANEALIKDLTAAEIQATFVCDKTFRGPEQLNNPGLSPVASAFAAKVGLANVYAMPTVDNLFDFVEFYTQYYSSGAGRTDPKAALKAANAQTVRFNIETKINPRPEFADRTFTPQPFVDALAGTIARRGLEARADIQSFDFRSLLLVQAQYPKIRTVYLFGDFPVYADPSIEGSDDGTNLQDVHGTNTPWLGGLFWPYRQTRLSQPANAQRSGGFEGMGQSPDGKTLYPILEKPLSGDAKGQLRIMAFDTSAMKYTGQRWTYQMDERGTSIGDFTLFNATQGLIIERDDTQGDLSGFKRVYEITLGAPGTVAAKRLVVDLMAIADPNGVVRPSDAAAGDVGLAPGLFAMPFTTIEDIEVLGPQLILVANDNNFPFSVGRHVGSKAPDDNEIIAIHLDRPLAVAAGAQR